MAIKLSELMKPSAFTKFDPITFGPSQQMIGAQSFAPQQPVKEEPSIFDNLSKAFKNFGTAMKTPGFQQVLGQMAQAIAPGPESWQAKLGAVGAQLGKGRQYDQYMQKLFAGQTPGPEDVVGLSPEEQNQAQQIVKTMQLKQAEQATAEKAQTANQFYTGALGTASLQAQQTAQAQLPIQQQEANARTMQAQKPEMRMEQVYSGQTPGQMQTYMYNAAANTPPIPVTTGQQQAGGSGGGLSASQEANLWYKNYDRMLAPIAVKYAKDGLQLFTDPTTGMIRYQFPPGTPQERVDAFEAERVAMIQSAIQAGIFPENFLNVGSAAVPAPGQQPAGAKKQWP